MADELDKETNESIIDNKEAKSPVAPEGKKKKEGSFLPMILMMIISIGMIILWDKIPQLKSAVHAVLDPSAGALLNLGIPFGMEIGMLIIVFAITLLSTLIQKFATDQKALKELRHEQKILQEEMKKYRDHPEKLMELQKKQFEFFPKTFKLTSRSVLFTGIPFILFSRWFYDTFTAMKIINNDVEPLFFGFLSWIWFYMIFMMIFSIILRKVLKVV